METMQYEWVGDYEVTLLHEPACHDTPYVLKVEKAGQLIEKTRFDNRRWAREEFDYRLWRIHKDATAGGEEAA